MKPVFWGFETRLKFIKFGHWFLNLQIYTAKEKVRSIMSNVVFIDKLIVSVVNI